MVTSPNRQTIPPTHEPDNGLKRMPPIEPAKIAAGSAGIKVGSNEDTANRDKTGDVKFKLPETVSPAEIKADSYRYGGGRSAGKLSTKR